MKKLWRRRETGVIVYSGTGEEERRWNKRGLGLLVLVLYFYAGIFGSVFGFLSIFPVDLNRSIIVAGILLIGLFYLLMYFSGSRFRIMLALTGATYLFLVHNEAKLLRDGASAVAGQIAEVVNSYGRAGQEVLSTVGVNRANTTQFFIMVIFVWAGIVFFSIMGKGGKLLSLLNMEIIVAAGLALGIVPGFVPVCLMGLCVLGTFSTCGIGDVRGQRDGGLAVGLLSLILLAAGHFLIAPAITPWFAGAEQTRERIQSTSLVQELISQLPNWRGGWATAGVGTGELDNADTFSGTEREVLRVTTDKKPEETVYLRCYAGEEYTGREWMHTGGEWDQESEVIYYDLLNSMALAYEVPGRAMDILLLDSDDSFDYRPYFSELQSKEGGRLSYEYYPRGLAETFARDGLLWEMDANYTQYVYDNYRSYPAEQLSRLEQLCRENPQENLLQIRDYIVETLGTTCSYNLQVGRSPVNSEFTEYFVFERKEGYCVHFATAAALMFRMYGVPSRYATGYIAPAADFVPSEDGYTASVKNLRAHAWAEIYMEGRGWIPVEATPGYSSGEGWQEDVPEKDTEQEQPDTQTEAPQKSAAGKKEIQKEPVSAAVLAWITRILAVCAAAALVVLIVLGRRRWILKRRTAKGAREVFWDIIAVLEFAGLPKNTELEQEVFEAAVRERFPWIEIESVGRMLDVAMRANYAREPVSKEETLYLKEMYDFICLEVYRDLSFVKRQLFRFIYVFA